MEFVVGGARGRAATLILAYLLLVYVGVDQLWHPSPLVESAYGAWHMLWAGMLIIGGALGAIGVLTNLWLVEVVAQPLLVTPFLAYGWIVSRQPDPRLSSVAILLLIVVYQVIRGVDVWWLAKHAPRRDA